MMIRPISTSSHCSLPHSRPTGSTVTAVLESAAGAVEHVVERTSQVADNLRRGLDIKSPEERVAGAQAETDRLAALMDERNTMSPAEMTQAQVGGTRSGVM